MGRSREGSSETDSDSATPKLLPLTAIYEGASHEVYFRAIEEAIGGTNHKTVRNIALTGSYGVGKSSILYKVAEEHADKVVQISLSTLGVSEGPDARPSDNLSQGAKEPTSKTNRIQKEIVKQLLYSEDPAKTPGSRYKRISRLKLGREFAMAALAALPITLAFFLTGWTKQLADLVHPLIDLGLLAHAYIYVLALGFVLAMSSLFHNRVRIEKVTAGAATIALSAPSSTYFDEYLDEIVYFFDVTKREIVIFEDIDRFDDPHIFETLRALNTLLNGAKQLKDRPIRFIYAIKDSIFDELGVRAARESGDAAPNSNDAADAEIARANRTKFFDLVIPVVPFITHQSARDHVMRIMEGAGTLSPELIDLAARHVADMRLIKNVRNEFLIFKQKVLPEGTDKLGLSEDALFAMMLYKSTHLSDFEDIKFGRSNLDKVYQAGRNLVSQNMARLATEERQTRRQLDSLDSIASRSRTLGTSLLRYIAAVVRQFAGTRPSAAVVLNGQSVSDEDLKKPDFWKAFLAASGPLQVPVTVLYGNTVTFTISPDDASSILRTRLAPEEWQESDRAHLKSRLEDIAAEREFLIHADMADLYTRTDLALIEQDGDNVSFPALADQHLNSELAKQLVAAGYIDRNFTLYTSTYEALRVSVKARNFIMHNVDPNVVDIHFELSPEDARAVIRERKSVLAERGMLNINLFDFALSERESDVLTRLLDSLTKSDSDRRDFLKAYLAGGTYQELLVRTLAPRWAEIFTFLVSEAELGDDALLQVVNAALEAMNPDVRYVAGDDVADFVNNHYLNLPVWASDSTSPARSAGLAKLLIRMGVRFHTLGPLGREVQKAVVAANRYVITPENLKIALGGTDDLALDAIRSTDEDVYAHVLEHLPEYFTAISTPGHEQPSVRAGASLEAIIQDVLDHDGSMLKQTIAAASSDCEVTDLTSAHQDAWPALADRRFFPCTFGNVLAYVRTTGSIDEHLAVVLKDAGSIADADDETDNEKRALARDLLAASDVLPGAELRTALVASLQIEGWLPASSVVPETGHLIGLLLEEKIIADDAQSYALTAGTDWPTREFAISKSEEFHSFMTPTEVPVAEVGPVLRSRVVPDRVKNALIARWPEFLGGAGRDTLAVVADYVIRSGTTLTVDQIAQVARAGVASSHVLQLLQPLLPSLTLEGIAPVLELLGGEYAAVAEKNGRRPKLPHTDADLALVYRLEQLEIVNSHEVSEGRISVNMKRGN